ncbi:MAG: hypothetical protein IIC78_12760 [Chloroflexi bacterium]|nr:hypothetical protein [Chloroflexota bacterium]
MDIILSEAVSRRIDGNRSWLLINHRKNIFDARFVEKGIVEFCEIDLEICSRPM